MKQRSLTLSLSYRQMLSLAMILSLAAIALPRAVEAATGSSMNITDPATATRKARVTSGGTLATGVCDPFTTPSATSCARVSGGKVRVGDGSGDLTVDGEVTAVPSLDTVHGGPVYVDEASFTLLLPAFAATEGFAISSIAFANMDSVALDVQILTTQTPCNGTGVVLDVITVASVTAGQSVQYTYPHPIVVPDTNPGTGWCLLAAPFQAQGGNGLGSDVRVSITGFAL